MGIADGIPIQLPVRMVHPLVAEREEDLDLHHGVKRTWTCDDEPLIVEMLIAEVLTGNEEDGFQEYEVYLDDEGTVQHRPVPDWVPGLPPGVEVEWRTPLT